MRSLDHGAEHGVIAAKEASCSFQVSCLDGAADGGAADNLLIDLHCGNPHFVEAEMVSHLGEQLEVAGAVAAEGPLVSDADFAQFLAFMMQAEDEILRIGRGKGLGKLQN